MELPLGSAFSCLYTAQPLGKPLLDSGYSQRCLRAFTRAIVILLPKVVDVVLALLEPGTSPVVSKTVSALGAWRRFV